MKIDTVFLVIAAVVLGALIIYFGGYAVFVFLTC